MMLKVALVATYQPCWTIEAAKEAHCMGIGSVDERGVVHGA